MVLKRQLLGEITVPHGLDKEGKCLGTDEVRGDYLMPLADLDTVGDQVQKGGGVDHIAVFSITMLACCRVDVIYKSYISHHKRLRASDEHHDEMEVETMLMRTDPFRDLDRLTQQVFGTAAKPALMAMDAWRDQDKFVVEFDLPGIDVESIDLDVERNVLTVRADRPAREGIEEWLAAERPRGVFSRQLMLGDTLDTDNVNASYQAGVLRLEIPVAEKARPRKITINSADEQTSVTTTEDQTAVAAAHDQHAVNA
jgi:HSP20 family protein